MAHIKILMTRDFDDCELCGITTDEGGRIEVDGKVIWEKIPQASCCGGEYLDTDFYFRQVLRYFGHTVEIE
jgi:hypothetical protein